MLARHSFVYFVARAVPALLSVVSLAVFTRLMPPAEYGTFTVLLAAIGFVNAAFFWWLRLGLLRFFPSFDGDRRVFLSTIAKAFLAIVAITVPIALIVWFVSPISDVGWLFWAGLALLWIQAGFELVQEVARCEFSPLRFGVLAFARGASFLALGTVFLLLDLGAAGLWLALVLALLAPTLVSGFSAFRTARLRLADSELLRTLVTYGLPLAGAFGLNIVVDSSDRLLIAALIDTESAGVYSAGYELTQRTLVVVMNVVYLAANPLVMRAFEKEGPEAARAQLATNQSLLLAVGLPCLTIMVLLSENITGVFFGDQYLRAHTIVPWIAAAAFLQGLRSFHTDLSFQLAKQTSRLALIASVAAALNVGLNFLWIPIYGIDGAAYATLASYLVALALSWSLGTRAFSLPRLGMTDLKTLAATVAMVAVLLPGRSSVGLLPLLVYIAAAVTVFGLSNAVLNTGNVRGRLRDRLRGVGGAAE